MNKIRLIIGREYLTRIRKKTFILSTVLFPLLYLGLILGTGYITAKSGRKMHVAVIDSSGYFTKAKIDSLNLLDSSSRLSLVTASASNLESNLEKSGYDGFIVVPATVAWDKPLPFLKLNTTHTMSMEGTAPVQSKINALWMSIKNEKLGIDAEKKRILEQNNIIIVPENIKDRKANSGVATAIGSVSAILIYIILLLYGSQVMMGVMEEKTNRIAEVIVSSVKPFQLMLGKILGIGLVCLTQILLWIFFILIIYNVTKLTGKADAMSSVVGGIQDVFTSSNMPLILSCFVFYLLGGFFFYASLFAAVGSAVNEDMREAQSLSFPLMMPIIFSVAMMTAVLKDPTGSLAFWGSIIPFSSPIIMMVRLPFGVPGTVPWWQLGLSMSLLIAGFIFTTWFAGKIYRTGILMYGKKPSWKEIIKWAFRKN
ncbi:MAG: ABC-2 family transporter protein [Bacteroidetes bacterium ADurb.BinA245]|jgi:ABC-2 type transport system permease protein|nr:MAG: ABC-2 family transporter protein [Bacteroidetes bacterium ADurb.BinA245]HMX77515.1 ABC transporter permease [Chitinophagaceae bacterium]HNA19461.1 ABC transporter permease [Chitinophagaceae bacterium]HNA90692.1 ABC transporter permease [Chitinophagaceae bacterium]HNA96188.1 ABC transporter permease [Chitinophagaceae bacterium]